MARTPLPDKGMRKKPITLMVRESLLERLRDLKEPYILPLQSRIEAVIEEYLSEEEAKEPEPTAE